MENKEPKRTFIAIPVSLPPELAATRDLLRMKFKNERIRWIPDRSMHLTLRFLGATEDLFIDEIAYRMKQRFSRQERFLIEFRGVGIFRHRSMLRVIWAGIDNPRGIENLRELTDEVVGKFVPDERKKPLRPHLTLARIKRPDDPEQISLEVARYSDVVLGTAVADRVIFYESILKSGGPEYRKLEEVFLSD